MISDSTPVFALEKEALKTEIETGLQVGVDHLAVSYTHLTLPTKLEV